MIPRRCRKQSVAGPEVPTWSGKETGQTCNGRPNFIGAMAYRPQMILLATMANRSGRRLCKLHGCHRLFSPFRTYWAGFLFFGMVSSPCYVGVGGLVIRPCRRQGSRSMLASDERAVRFVCDYRLLTGNEPVPGTGHHSSPRCRTRELMSISRCPIIVDRTLGNCSAGLSGRSR